MKAKKANDKIRRGLLNLGAKQIPSFNECKFTIETKYGELTVTLSTPVARDKIFSCYSRFTNVDEAKKHTNCNPFSGKWNWCVWAKDFTPESFAEIVIKDISRILVPKPNIASRQFWGYNPSIFTTITKEEVDNGIWKSNPKSNN